MDIYPTFHAYTDPNGRGIENLGSRPADVK